MIVAVGLDGTCCDSAWRRDRIETSWDAYHQLCVDDAAVEVVRDLVNSLHESGHIVVALTSRPQKWLGATASWLLWRKFSISQILMRSASDFRPEAEVKIAIRPRNVKLVIDDSDAVIAAFRGIGVTCLQVGRPA